jgi:hypothetical protein
MGPYEEGHQLAKQVAGLDSGPASLEVRQLLATAACGR